MQRARTLLGGDPAEALAAGAAPLLRHGLGAGVASILTSERAGRYLTILFALMVRRRGHELEPLHDDVWHLVAGPAEALGPYDPAGFAQDLEQLVAWGAIARRTEAQRLRSYKDNRRDRHRYRIEEDAVALLEWLEARVLARLDGRAGDGRDRLADVVGQLRELTRLLERWHQGTRDGDAARRALYLIEAIGDAIDEVATELIALRAAMLSFASQTYDLAALREILGDLERYLKVYVARIAELRVEIEERLRALSAPRLVRGLEECRTALASDLAAAPRMARRGAGPAAPGPRLAAHAAFFAPTGPLAAACRRVEASAREVLHKMWRHLAELERRNARLTDLRAAVRMVAALAARDPRLGELGTAVVAAAHGRFDRRTPAPGSRATPPMPRRHARSEAPIARTPLATKRGSPEAARALRARRLDELRRWLADQVLGERDRVRLSERELDGPDAPRRWIEIARARHLARGAPARLLGAGFVDAEGTATVADGRTQLTAPDCWIEKD